MTLRNAVSVTLPSVRSWPPAVLAGAQGLDRFPAAAPRPAQAVFQAIIISEASPILTPHVIDCPRLHRIDVARAVDEEPEIATPLKYRIDTQ